MEPLQNAATEAVRRVLDAQPTTAAKIAFAWKMVAGRAVGRATEAEWRGDTALVVRTHGDAWRREILAARPLLLSRLQDLLATLARERHQTFVIVTHNDRLGSLADRVLTLDAGRLVAND